MSGGGYGKGKKAVKAKLQSAVGRQRQLVKQGWAQERHKQRPGTARQGRRGR